MAVIINSDVATKVIKVNPFSRHPISLSDYEIPERYKNSFYLANASLFDTVNWFLHRAYELSFSTLTDKWNENAKETKVQVQDKIKNVINVMDQCNSIVDVRFPIKRDDGSIEMIRGFRGLYGLGAGFKTSLGGLRIDGKVTRDHIKGFSVLSAYRNACLGIGMAGAHGGIKINPKDYSHNELQQIVEKYCIELMQRGYCCEKDVILPDINCTVREMSFISQAYRKYTGHNLNLGVTGTSPEFGGFDHYSSASAMAAFIALNFFLDNGELMKTINLDKGLKGKTFIIQGLGNLGRPLAELLVSEGATCIGIKDIDAYIYDPKGIDLQKIFEHKSHTGSIQDFGKSKAEVNDKIFKDDCDILIFAACHKSLICYVADDVKAKLILEAADGAITPAAHQILTGRGKLVVPDIFCCSGAAIASYLEYLKNLQEIKGVDVDILRCSNTIYENALNSFQEREQKLAVGGSNVQVYRHSSARNTVPDTVECVLSEVGKNLFEIMELYKLGTDVRVAAYIIAINNIFKSIFNWKGLVI